MKRLTEKQQKILDYIAEFTRTQEIAPTVHELASHFGIKSSTMFIHLRTLQKKNCLTRNSKARSIKLLSPDGKPEKLARRITNAVAIPVISNFRPEMVLDPAAYGSGKVYLNREDCKYSSGTRIFAIKAEDDRLKGVGIFANDTLIIAAGPDVDKKSLLVVEIDKKAYVGFLGQSGATKVLKFTDDAFPAIKIPTTGPQIIGKVIGVMRQL